MGFVGGIANTVIAFAPIVVMFVLNTYKSSKAIILALAAGFAWIVPLFAVSIIFVIASPLNEANYLWALLAVAAQEGWRKYMYNWWQRIEDGLAPEIIKARWNSGKQPPAPFVSGALAQGVGIGFVTVLVMYGSFVTEQFRSRAFYPAPGCPSNDGFYVLAVNYSVLGALHILWSLVAAIGYRDKALGYIGLTVLGHLVYSLSSAASVSVGVCFLPAYVGGALLLLTLAVATRLASNYASKVSAEI